MLPTPHDATAPCERQCPDGGLMGGALVARWVVVGTGPAGRPHCCSGPLHARVSQACGALQTPMDPAVVSTAFRDRCHARVRLALIGRGVAVAWFPEGDAETRGQDRAGAWEGMT
jgi:hypothetical protein